MKQALSIALLSAGLVLAQPTIDNVQNSANNVPQGLANAAIAQGSLFVIKGSGLGPANYVVANKFPLSATSVNNGVTSASVSVKITVNGKATDGIVYYAGPAQVAAVIPSATSVGVGTLTVTYNGQASAAIPITVVANNLGIFSVDSSGTGDAIATFGNALVSPANAPRPGDIVAFWGTGLGPVAFDETNAAQQFDMTDVPVKAYVSGQPANVVFRGRNACCTAVDTVYIQIPPGLSGCANPVTFQIGNLVSNTTTIPIGSANNVCTPTSSTLATPDFAGALASGSITVGGISLVRSVQTTQNYTVGGIILPGNTTRADSASAAFQSLTPGPGGLGAGALDLTAYGGCAMTFYSSQYPQPPQYSYKALDAGPSITVAGPNAVKAMPKISSAGIISYGAPFDNAGTYLATGSYSASASGGPDIGAFTASLTLPQPITWTDMPAAGTLLAIDRTKPFTVHWSGGDPDGYVQISGASFAPLSGTNTAVASFTCTAHTSDASFAIPSFVLLALPPTSSVAIDGISMPLFGTLAVTGVSAQSAFKAAGLTYGNFGASVVNSAQITYQ
jgi:uncharacterized protein (TIGR03437 family)